MPRLNEQLGFGYDAAHNLDSRTSGNLSEAFNVDAANELTSVTRTGTFTVSGATPAPATNITVNGQAAQTYGDFTFAATNLSLADGQNSFTNIAQNVYGVTVTNMLTANLPQSVTLGFDNNGNLTNDGTKSLSYDAENQLTNIMVAGRFKKDFVYDGLNRLRIKCEYTWTGSAWTQTNETRLIYDGAVVIQLRDSNNVPMLTLTRGLDVNGSLWRAGGIGGLLAMTEYSGANSYYHANGAGNITALMDANENIVGRRLYGPFGNTLSLSGSKAGINPFWFSSQLYDEDTGTAHFLRRDYLPNLQRWSALDPIGERGGINLYRAVDNNPIDLFDPFGLTDYNSLQTQMFLAQAYGSATAGPMQGLYNIAKNSTGQYDFKNDKNPNHGSTWCVNGQRMDAAQFGNYIAGFEGAAYDATWASGGAPVAEAGVKAGGIFYHVGDAENGDIPWSDALDSSGRPDINAGENAASNFLGSPNNNKECPCKK